MGAYRIPLFDLSYDAEERLAITRTLENKWISMGPTVEALEDAFARHLGARHAISLTNGTAALHLALCGLGIGPGDEVIVSSMTFVATVNVIKYVGATPVFADILGREDLSMDPSDVARKITTKTRAIVCLHYAGFPARLTELLGIASAHDLPLVEDASHAPDSQHEGRHLGTFGVFGCFSFYANKNISCAEGGMLVTSDERLAGSARLMRSHGMTTTGYARSRGAGRYHVEALGYNYRFDDVRASLALCQLRKLDWDTAERARIRKQYEDLLEPIEEISVPYSGRPDIRSSNCIFPILLDTGGAEQRDRFRAELANRGIETSVHYQPVHTFDIYRQAGLRLARTERVGETQVTLPMFPGLSEAQVAEVCHAVKAVTREVYSP